MDTNEYFCSHFYRKSLSVCQKKEMYQKEKCEETLQSGLGREVSPVVWCCYRVLPTALCEVLYI